jgi:hypothetical protein
MALRLSQDLKGIADNRSKHADAQRRVLDATEKLAVTFQETAQARANILLAGPENNAAQNTDKDAALRLGNGSNDNQDAPLIEAPQPEKKPGGPMPG